MSEPGILPEPIPFGKYYLLERVNVGGMAEVYKAKAFGVEGFERLLAIKKILDSIAEDESFIKMFIDEAKIAGQLNHPNIAQIFDLGQVDDSYFIALEYIGGKDLKTKFERARRIGEEVSIPRICYTIMKVCEGLGHAHEKKDPQGRPLDIVHRDISPQNILVSYEGEVKIIDFGIAKAQGKTSQTQVGILKGKFSYMSPEQVRGLHVDHRSDLFSLGIVMYEMLTLERLFLGESDFDTLEKIRKVEMSPPSLYNPHIPKGLEDIVLKALARTPEERYQSTYELAEDLELFMRNQGYYYTNKDLAAYMKEAFQADIEFENKKLEYYRSLDLQPIMASQAPAGQSSAPTAADLSWGDEEMETQIFGREDEEEESITESDIVYAEDVGHVHGGGAGDDEVTQIHVPGLADDDPTMEYNRWDEELDLAGQRSGGGRGIEIEPRRQPQPTAQMHAVERRPEPQAQVTVPNAQMFPQSQRTRGKSGSKTRLGVVALVAVLVVGIGLGVYYFMMMETTAAVTFDFGEDPVVITVDGEVIHEGATPFETELPAGVASIVVEREHHYALELNETFEAGQARRVAQELTPHDFSDTGFDLVTAPEEATLFVDGEEYDETTPVEVRELKPGSYEIKIVLDDYLEETREVEITYDAVVDVAVELRPAQVALVLSSTPNRSDYKILDAENDDEIASGRTPDTIEELDARLTYRVVVERNRYEDWEETFEPGMEREVEMEAELEREETAVADASAGSSPRRSDGGSARQAPEPTPRRTRPQPEPEPEPEPARAEPRPTPTPDPPAEPEPAGTGTLTVASRPVARVYINDRDTGHHTPLRDFELPVGSHKVVLVNDEFNLNKTYYVDIEAGAEERIINR